MFARETDTKMQSLRSPSQRRFVSYCAKLRIKHYNYESGIWESFEPTTMNDDGFVYSSR